MIIHDKWENYLDNIPDKSIDCILIDPPYNTTNAFWDHGIDFEAVWRQVKRLLKDRKVCLVFGTQPFTTKLISSNPDWFRYAWIWDKTFGRGHLVAKFRPMQQTEDIVCFAENSHDYYPQKVKRDKPFWSKEGNGRSCLLPGERSKNHQGQWLTEKNPTNLLSFLPPSNNKRVHPTQKPVPLLEYLIKTYTKEGETILDFFAGSGSTGEAAKNLNRNCILIERNGFYIQKMSERLQEQVKCKTSGCTFCERTNRARTESCC